jgi:hypothetical protein
MTTPSPSSSSFSSDFTSEVMRLASMNNSVKSLDASSQKAISKATELFLVELMKDSYDSAANSSSSQPKNPVNIKLDDVIDVVLSKDPHKREQRRFMESAFNDFKKYDV